MTKLGKSETQRFNYIEFKYSDWFEAKLYTTEWGNGKVLYKTIINKINYRIHKTILYDGTQND